MNSEIATIASTTIHTLKDNLFGAFIANVGNIAICAAIVVCASIVYGILTTWLASRR